MTETQSRAAHLPLIGGRLCLDFTNTAAAHNSPHPKEYLTTYTDLLAWSRYAGILTDQETECLAQEATVRPTAATAVLEWTIALRTALYQVFSAVAANRSVSEDSLETLNVGLSKALAHSRLLAVENSFTWGWTGGEDELERPLWSVVHSAIELLTSPELHRVRECLGANCGWLFVDMTRNRSRQWCEMKVCGNRAKARRRRQREGHAVDAITDY